MPAELIVVSNSEISTFNTCERRHYYQFILGKEPRLISLALYRGIIGHVAWEQYYLQGQSVEAAKEVLQIEFLSLMKNHPGELKHMEALTYLSKLIEWYAEFYRDESFNIIETETVHKVPISDEVKYGLKLDMLIEYYKGPYRGDLAIMDHKFIYNFKTQHDIDMDPQLPKYIKALQVEGLTVSKGVFNQIRYRPLKDAADRLDEIFRRTPPIKPTPLKMNNIWNEQIKSAHKIHAVKMRDMGSQSIRALHFMLCRGCPFKAPCHAELSGHDITQMLAIDFQDSKYGYTEEED